MSYDPTQSPRLEEYNQAQAEHLFAQREAMLDEVFALDPELFEDEATRRMVELGINFIEDVTRQHGSPDDPHWSRGSREETVMTFHNGESEYASGHTSVGRDGAGVPSGVLILSGLINRSAGRTIVPAWQRALLFVAAAAHDSIQLCGRSFDNDNGDEEQSANQVRAALLAEGFSEQIADEGATYVMATMFNIKEMRQAVQTEGHPPHVVLGQQIIAAADLRGPATRRGALGSMEWIIEESGLSSTGRLLQQHLKEQGLTPANVATLGDVLAFVNRTPALKQHFITKLRTQATFIEGLRYQDSAIREACGQGIDDFYPGGRMRTAARLRALASAAEAGATLYQIWVAELQSR